MSDEAQVRNVNLSDLPTVIASYLDAHRNHETMLALNAFADNAVVEDDDRTYQGRSAIDAWLNRSSSEYTYTITPIAVHQIDDSHFVVVNHLEGNFPGGQVDLRYQFTLGGGRITHLTIEV